MGVTERVVAGWILEERLGTGGFGEVWRARKRHVDLERALKLAPIADERTFASWRHEIERLETLSHPNIVRFYDADMVSDNGPYQNYAWIATELCEHSLAEELHNGQGQGLDEHDCEQLVDQMLAALTAAHTDACVHRDLKPGNILRHRSGTWKLCDFGTARLIPQGELHPHTSVVGTSPYMSAAAHRGYQDQAADLYALGVTVHEALSGQRLHARPPGMTDSEYVKLILDTPPAISADLPDRWQNVIRALTAADHAAPPTRELHDWFRKTRGHAPLASMAPTTQPGGGVADGQAETQAGEPSSPVDPTAVAEPPGDDGIVLLSQTAPWQDDTNLQRPTEVQQPTGFAQPEAQPAQQTQRIFVPAPVPEPAPSPAPSRPVPHAPPPPPPPAPRRDEWQATDVVGRRAVAFCVDALAVWFFATLIWMIIYGAMLMIAYDKPSSAEVGDSVGAFCRAQVAAGNDCREFRGDGDVYVRDEALLSSESIGTVTALVVILYIGVSRQGRRGTTPGKRLTGLRTVGPDGHPPGRGRALVRTGLLPVDLFVWPLMIFSARSEGNDQRTRESRRRLGDRVADTWVLRNQPQNQPRNQPRRR
jgi:serine/threonine protein kinase